MVPSRAAPLLLMLAGVPATAGPQSPFGVEEAKYKRFMDFLRQNRCRVDFRPYRDASRTAKDNAGESSPTEWYHPAGDHGEGKKDSRPVWTAADPSQNDRVFPVFPPGSRQKFTKVGIVG